MARGIILSAPTFNTIPGMPLTFCKIPFMTHLHLPHCRSVSWTRFFCKCGSSAQDTAYMTKYHEAFSSRMNMAGLKSHHRIALGVSGGPDSIALCVLTAYWKTNGRNVARDSGGFIDGLLAIVVDHGLRAESKEEANIVSHGVSKMGIKCEIAHCDWLDGRPQQGHLLEAARDMRYQILQKICIQNQIGVLLIAHHADDQAELFILRLSRNSGVLGLAGMPFVSQIFSSYTHFYSEASKNYGVLLVRPLLDFSKEDTYKICQGGDQDWVEDPTNQSPSYARNRIRMSLRDLSSSCRFKSELQVLISACQKVRIYVDHICSNLMSKIVTINDLGYAVLDLEILNQSKPDDICLSRFLALILQFISQRHRPIRGSTSKLLLEYIQTFPCKTSLTAAGCYLCPSPGSKGTKVLVCWSVDCPLPITVELFDAHSFIEKKQHIPDDMEQIIADSKSVLDSLVPDASDVYFLDMASESVLAEAKKMNMLSESTYTNILMLKSREAKHFKSNIKVKSESEMKEDDVKSVSKYRRELLYHGQICCFMNRFFVTWKLSDKIIERGMFKEASCDQGLGGESWCYCCGSCRVGNIMVAEIRHMIDSDWLYLANLSKCPNSENCRQQNEFSASGRNQTTGKANSCFPHARLSAQKALLSLKRIPAAARRGLPVLVNDEGILLSIPSIGFKHCPRLNVSTVFKPRVPLGGGHSSFL